MTKMLQDLIPLLGWVLLFFVPTMVVGWLVMRSKRVYQAEAKEPFTDLPLRLPGESTRQEGEKHFERGMEAFLVLAGASAFFGFAVAMAPAVQRRILGIAFGVLTVAIAVRGGTTDSSIASALLELPIGI